MSVKFNGSISEQQQHTVQQEPSLRMVLFSSVLWNYIEAIALKKRIDPMMLVKEALDEYICRH